MADRFIRIQDLPEKKYQKDCQIVIEKGALLKDTTLDKCLLQLKFKSKCQVNIKAMIIQVDCYDTTHEFIKSQEYSYLDMDIKYGDLFGDREAIYLDDVTSREFQFSVKKIVTTLGEVINYKDVFANSPEIKPISSLGKYADQYIREFAGKKVRPLNLLSENTDVWLCTCGNLNFDKRDACDICRSTVDYLVEISSIDYLRENDNRYLENKRIEEENRKQREEEERKQKEDEINRRKQEESKLNKRKKENRERIFRVSLTAVMICSVVVAIILGRNIYIYDKAQKLEAQKSYYEARLEYGKLNGYRDSNERIYICKEAEANKLVVHEEYAEAKILYEELEAERGQGSYSDLIKKCEYGIFSDYLSNGDYDNANTILLSLSEKEIKDELIPYLADSPVEKIVVDRLISFYAYEVEKDLSNAKIFDYFYDYLSEKSKYEDLEILFMNSATKCVEDDDLTNAKLFYSYIKNTDYKHSIDELVYDTVYDNFAKWSGDKIDEYVDFLRGKSVSIDIFNSIISLKRDINSRRLSASYVISYDYYNGYRELLNERELSFWDEARDSYIEMQGAWRYEEYSDNYDYCLINDKGVYVLDYYTSRISSSSDLLYYKGNGEWDNISLTKEGYLYIYARNFKKIDENQLPAEFDRFK